MFKTYSLFNFSFTNSDIIVLQRPGCSACTKTQIYFAIQISGCLTVWCGCSSSRVPLCSRANPISSPRAHSNSKLSSYWLAVAGVGLQPPHSNIVDRTWSHNKSGERGEVSDQPSGSGVKWQACRAIGVTGSAAVAGRAERLPGLLWQRVMYSYLPTPRHYRCSRLIYRPASSGSSGQPPAPATSPSQYIDGRWLWKLQTKTKLLISSGWRFSAVSYKPFIYSLAGDSSLTNDLYLLC